MADTQEEIELLQNLDCLVNNTREFSITNDDILDNKIDLSNKILTIIHLNIRSLSKNFNEFICFLEGYNLKFCDIIVLTETWKLGGGDDFYIDGYNMYYNGADFNKNDGTVVYVRSNISHSVTHSKFGLSKVTLTTVELNIMNTSIRLFCIYRPPSTSTCLFLSDIETFFSNTFVNQVDIMMGDLNLNLLDEVSNEVLTYNAMLSCFGFVSAINSPTRVTTDCSSILDHIFLRKNPKADIDSSSYVIQSTVTDHYPTMINLNCGSTSHLTRDEPISQSDIKIDFPLLKNLVAAQNFDSILNEEDPETATEMFYDVILTALNLAKTQKVYMKNSYKKIKPWVTNGIITSIKTRDRMKRKLLKNNTLENKIAFTQYRNNLKVIILKRKHDYYKSKIHNCGTNLKKMYKVVNEATDSNNQTKDTNLDITCNNVKFDDKKDMANFCNDFFVSVGYNMFQKIKVPPAHVKAGDLSPYSMFLRPTSRNEIIKHISSLKNSCAPGADQVTSKVAKLLHIHIATPLAHIINLIFRTAKVPKPFKVAIVKPIHKSGDKTDVSNYRPISIINTFAKIFEKCLKDRLVDFFNKNNTISKRQFGFRSGMSTTDAVCELCEKVTNSLDCGKKCLAVFLDLAKAFDTVPHDMLLQVLETYGVRGSVLDVFHDYLRDRSQSVKIGHILSDPLGIKMGIPQGTVLGPVLFIAYINSLTDISIENGTVVSYADDTAVVFTGETWESVEGHAVEGISKVKVWLDSFKLSLNVAKTNYIAFSHTSVNRPMYNSLHIHCLNDPIASVDSTKYLGIVIDKHLRWDHHILRLSKNIRKLIHKFYIIREILNRQLLILTYKGIVESLLRYGVVVWGGLYQNALAGLNIIQNYILKVIYRKDKRYSTALLYSKEIFDVRSLYCLSACAHVHRSDRLKNFINHSYQTRINTSNHIAMPSASSSRKLRSFVYLAPKIYNLLPLHIRIVNKQKKFCTATRDFIYDNLEKFMKIF